MKSMIQRYEWAGGGMKGDKALSGERRRWTWGWTVVRGQIKGLWIPGKACGLCLKWNGSFCRIWRWYMVLLAVSVQKDHSGEEIVRASRETSSETIARHEYSPGHLSFVACCSCSGPVFRHMPLEYSCSNFQRTWLLMSPTPPLLTDHQVHQDKDNYFFLFLEPRPVLGTWAQIRWNKHKKPDKNFSTPYKYQH